MNKAVELLKKSRIFHIATMEGKQPRVRPFGAVADINGKLYICTNNTKPCFHQMKENPYVEISAMLDQERWFRIHGTVAADSDIKAKEEFLQQNPLPMYKADDPIFEVLYFTKGTATVYSFSGEPESFDL